MSPPRPPPDPRARALRIALLAGGAIGLVGGALLLVFHAWLEGRIRDAVEVARVPLDDPDRGKLSPLLAVARLGGWTVAASGVLSFVLAFVLPGRATPPSPPGTSPPPGR